MCERRPRRGLKEPIRARRHFALCLGAVLAILGGLSQPARAQQVRAVELNHVVVGMTLGIYPTGGGFGLSDQSFEYQGVHLDVVRLGFSQLVSRRVRMELVGLFGLSVLADPGYRPAEGGESEQSSVGYHWGFGLSASYLFDVGLTLGLGAELTFGFGEYLDTTFFRLVPAIGWELGDPVGDWYVDVRWVVGLTLLNGLREANRDPDSNLSVTGLQVIYGF